MNKTPHILFLMILGFFMVEPSNAIANAFSPQNDSGDTISKSKNDEFDGWTEEQYKHYEDSIIFKLYSPVISCKSEAPPVNFRYTRQCGLVWPYARAEFSCTQYY